ncbi:hypothetical protein FOA52_007137 [Chlamydomonas sp. UWO 241]|nr:hypothetical protein FOA52_007137 [Chlamydomonas sp. UWO 241]
MQAAAAAGTGPSSAFWELRRPSVASRISSRYGDVLKSWPAADQQQHLPLVYSPKYNITFFGIEKLHPFDSAKFSKIARSLTASGLVAHSQLVEPLEASLELLKDVHTEEYVTSIQTSSWRVAQVTELQALFALPPVLLRWRVVSPMRYHVAGTVAAAGLAMQYGWAINLGGGMHHAHASGGGGWCPFDDVYLAVRRLRDASGGEVKKVMYIDLDAHQGNGVERDKLRHDDNDLFIIDVYNAGVYPKDDDAKPAINISVELRSQTDTYTYLARLDEALVRGLAEFPSPDLIVYNAGTDVLEGDPLGRLSVNEAGVLARDAAVWDFALTRARCPIVMTLSGGYAARSAAVVADSLAALIRKYRLTE